MPGKKEWNTWLSWSAWGYRWRKWWPVLGGLFLAAGFALVFYMTMTGCYATPAERDAVRRMPETTAKERAEKKLAWIALDERDATEDAYWTWGSIAATVVGLGVAVQRANAARKLSVALGVTTDHIEALNPSPEFKDKMLADQIAKGVHKTIQKKRKKPVKQKVRGKPVEKTGGTKT